MTRQFYCCFKILYSQCISLLPILGDSHHPPAPTTLWLWAYPCLKDCFGFRGFELLLVYFMVLFFHHFSQMKCLEDGLGRGQSSFIWSLKEDIASLSTRAHCPSPRKEELTGAPWGSEFSPVPGMCTPSPQGVCWLGVLPQWDALSSGLERTGSL